MIEHSFGGHDQEDTILFVRVVSLIAGLRRG